MKHTLSLEALIFGWEARVCIGSFTNEHSQLDHIKGMHNVARFSSLFSHTHWLHTLRGCAHSLVFALVCSYEIAGGEGQSIGNLQFKDVSSICQCVMRVNAMFRMCHAQTTCSLQCKFEVASLKM